MQLQASLDAEVTSYIVILLICQSFNWFIDQRPTRWFSVAYSIDIPSFVVTTHPS
jgi:hypothetical protein